MHQTHDPIILATDLGTSGMKVALITIQGEVLGWESEPVKLILTHDGGAEQSPSEWWSAFIKSSKRLLAQKPELSKRVCAICCSTQGEGTVPVDQDGNELGNCILWMDMRGAPYLKQQLHGVINIDGASINHVVSFIHKTGGMPSMTGKDPAGHMLYIREKMPKIYKKTYKFLNVLDYLNLRLTGEFAATSDSIFTSWVTDNRDLQNINYDQKLINILGIDRAKLPNLLYCTDVVGDILPSVAEDLGLNKDVKIVAGAIDNTASAIGSGTIEDYATHLYIGTSSWMAAHVPMKKTDIFASLASIPCAVPDKYLLTALQATAGGNLTFLRDQILYHKDELLQEAHVPDIFKVLDIIAERVPPGSNGVLYTPWIWGERAPIDDKYVRAGLYNLSLDISREDIIRAFLEGVAFNTRWLMDPFEKFIRRKVDQINIVGGGAQSAVWCQIFADVMNVKINQVKDPIYANARGAAWIGAVGLGLINFQDVSNLIKFNQTYLPNPTNRAVYDDQFNTFKKIYQQMKGIYQHLNK